MFTHYYERSMIKSKDQCSSWFSVIFWECILQLIETNYILWIMCRLGWYVLRISKHMNLRSLNDSISFQRVKWSNTSIFPKVFDFNFQCFLVYWCVCISDGKEVSAFPTFPASASAQNLLQGPPWFQAPWWHPFWGLWTEPRALKYTRFFYLLYRVRF